MTALQVLSMVMTDSGNEDEILDLAVAALPSLSRHCRAEAVWLDGEWRSVNSLRGGMGPRAGLEAQLAGLGVAGGAIQSSGLGWAWAFPLASRGGATGYVVVGSRGTPPEHERSLMQGLAQQTGVALANARLLRRERSTRARISEEQATLRRVATLVARSASPDEVFAAVAAEVGQLLGVDFAVLSRYGSDGTTAVVGGWAKTEPGRPFAVGTRVELGGRNIHTLVFQTGRPARIDEYGNAAGPAADTARRWAFRSAVGTPIYVESRLWGVINVASNHEEPLPADTEVRLAAFTELVGTALAHAETQGALAASRARIVAAADTARRRIERDLHDGAQQQLVSLALKVRAAQAAVPAEADELTAKLDEVADGLANVLEELRETARGIHPAALAEGGLAPALKALSRRSPVPVRLDVRVEGRVPAQIELAAYYVVAEGLTNAAKHARAAVIDVEVAAQSGVLRVGVRDDGNGGADVTRGSGLVGLTDRVGTLGGRLSLHSPRGAGTNLLVQLPLDTPT
ncbi:MAG TPA: GAF domain-containing protein [Acidimicrobiales bacterium]|nr:GAF domain-containing protein [Acidimicrobiales bacterium]